MKRRNGGSDDVAASELLADYVVTRAPTMKTTTGLPPVLMPDEEPEPEPEMRPVQERRRERRVATVRRVIASHPGSDRDLLGVTNNISITGMCLVMPEPPPAIHQDVLVTDSHGSSTVWIQVMSHRVAPTEGYVWHVRVTAADGAWEELVTRASGQVASKRRNRKAKRDRTRDRDEAAAS
jgi:hypothetical protein